MARQVYTEAVKFVIALTILLLASSASYAAHIGKDDAPALGPPTEVHDTPEARETVQTPSGKVNLRDELSGPELEHGVEVQSYKRKDGVTVHEYAIKGRVYMVKVEPGAGLPAYYLYDTDGDGVFERRLPGGYKKISPPMWVIQRF